MTLIQLQSLCAVADEGSFTRAAETMFVTQPALSMQIKKLEDEIGEVLVDRSGGKVVLTEAGHILASRARQVLGELENAVEEVSQVGHLERGTLSLACSDTIAEYFLVPFLSEFVRRHPKVHVALQNKATVQIEELLLDNKAEIGLVTLPASLPQLTSSNLFSYKEHAVYQAEGPLGGQESLSLEQLAANRLLVLPPGTRSRMLQERDFARAGVELPNVMELGSVHLLKAFARIGFGVALVPEYAVAPDELLSGIASCRIPDLTERQVGIVYRAKRQLSAAARSFIAMVAGRQPP
jgi:LysR family cyn operon transcriptional activator